MRQTGSDTRVARLHNQTPRSSEPILRVCLALKTLSHGKGVTMSKRRKLAWPSPHINGVMGVYCILSAGIAIYRFEIDFDHLGVLVHRTREHASRRRPGHSNDATASQQYI